MKCLSMPLYTQTVKGSMYQLLPKYTVVTRDWSSCSVSCGNGRISRVVTCIHPQERRKYTCTYQRKCQSSQCIGEGRWNTCIQSLILHKCVRHKPDISYIQITQEHKLVQRNDDTHIMSCKVCRAWLTQVQFKKDLLKCFFKHLSCR